MLDEVEYAQLSAVLVACLESIQLERKARGVALERIDVRAHHEPARRLHEELTGVAIVDAGELRHHRDSLLGPDCGRCGRALRSPSARSCAECGAEFPGTTESAASPESQS